MRNLVICAGDRLGEQLRDMRVQGAYQLIKHVEHVTLLLNWSVKGEQVGKELTNLEFMDEESDEVHEIHQFTWLKMR